MESIIIKIYEKNITFLSKDRWKTFLAKIIEEIEKITSIGKSPRDKQKEINVTEASLVWDLLTTRYDTLETNTVFENWAEDLDLKIILAQGDKFISKEIEILENLTTQYGIPSPPRTTVNPLKIINTEVLSDKYIYRHTLGIWSKSQPKRHFLSNNMPNYDIIG